MTMPGALVAARVLSGTHHGSSLSGYVDESELRTFCLAFRPDNKIHLFPPSIQTAQLLRDAVEKHWSLEGVNHGLDCYTVELKGAPFLMYSTRENALLIKYICCLILECYKAHGWDLIACTDMSNKTDLTAWYFAREPTDQEGAQLRSPTADGSSSLVCLSLSAKGKLQLINAPFALQNVLRETAVGNYEPGIDQDSRHGRDYEIKLKGSPWDTDNRDEIVAACKLILAAFSEFGNRHYHLYGLVNLKDTADSLFFEYDPNQTLEGDQYMIMALDEHNILRLINASPNVVEVVKSAIDYYWLFGLEGEGRIGVGGKGRSPKRRPPQEHDANLVCWEFVLKGSPWQVPASKIGRSRQFVTHVLDALLAHGWTVVTGLDISRALNKKSALLFQSCPSVRGVRHACLSPLGKQRYQLINAPSHLQQLVRDELGDVVVNEKMTEDHSVYELTLGGMAWWVTDNEHDEQYVYVRRRMGALLQTLMDAGWCVIASADVSRQIREDTEGSAGEGIHSWFLIYCGSDTENMAIKVTANSVLQVAGRIGTARPNSPFTGCRPCSSACPSPRRLSPVRARRTASFRPRKTSPASRDSTIMRMRRRSSAGHEF